MQLRVISSVVLWSVILLQFTVNAKTARYRVMWRDDPSTTMVIGWDQVSGSAPQVFYGPRDFGTDYNRYPNNKKPDNVVAAKGMQNHFARISGLRPNTVYYFVIKDSEGVSKRMSFQTAPDSFQRLSIVAGGDSRNFRDARRKANKLVSKLRPHCIMFSGDMTDGDAAKEWREWFDDWQETMGSDGRLFPIIVTRGNHESSNRSLIDLFDVNGPDLYYALLLGGGLLRIYTLNTMIPSGGQQRLWLAKDLERHQSSIWKFAQYHQAMRPHASSKAEKNELILDWATLFHKYGVQLAVESDAHVVKWTYPIRPSREPGSKEGFIRDDDRGTVYIGEGCWGAPLRKNDDNKPWTRNSGSFNQFKWIVVDQEKVQIRTLMTDKVDQVAEVNHNNIFELPYGLQGILWKPSNGSVLEIRNQIVGAPVLLEESGNRNSNLASESQAVQEIRPDPSNGNVLVKYYLKSPSAVSIVLVNARSNRQVSSFDITGDKPGPHSKSVNFSKISPGEYSLIVKNGGEIIKKYKVVNP